MNIGSKELWGGFHLTLFQTVYVLYLGGQKSEYPTTDGMYKKAVG